MRWCKPILILFLLCISKSRSVVDSSEENWDLTKEDSDYDDRYDKEERRDPIHHQKFEYLLVCQPSGADFCECEKTTGSINCRKSQRSKSGKKVEPLETAAISVKLPDFKAKYVYLTGNQISSLSARTLMPDIASDIIGLDVSFNDIEDIERGAFDKMTSLKKLRLNQNWINNLDGWITPTLGKNLELLNLGYNSIETIRDGVFDNLPKLKKLLLDKNPGIKLTDGTFGKTAATPTSGLYSLVELSIDNCNFTTLPDKLFVNLPNLQNLSLIGNQLTSIPRALTSITNLITLDLSKNPFTKWESNALQGNPTIKKLLLVEMFGIKTYGECAFCGMSNLTSIELYDSKNLESLDENAFGYPKDHLKSLKKVILDNCKLSTLHEYMLPWDNLDALGISGNPWNCDKNLQWLIRDSNLHLFVGNGVPKCAAPPELKDKPIQKLMKEQKGSTDSGGIGFFRSIFYMGTAIGVVGTALVITLVITKRFKVISLTRQRTSGVGFSNLNAGVEAEDGNVFEDDDEFVVRPAAV